MRSILNVKNLNVWINDKKDTIHALRNVSFTLHEKEMLALVGESGCGKSLTAKALLNVLPSGVLSLSADEMQLDSTELTHLTEKEYQKLRGNQMAMILQDPIGSLNPTRTVGQQVGECVKKSIPSLSRAQIKERVIKWLYLVKLPDPQLHYTQYPFELSGGMCQRVCIAMAFAFEPQIIIADEPTTALDVTTQADILALMKELQQQTGVSILFITHDLGVVKKYCDRALVMYGGTIVENINVEYLFQKPEHPYTQLLLNSLPTNKDQLKQVKGQPIDLSKPIKGCAFFERCPKAMNICHEVAPPSHKLTENCKCWLPIKKANENKHELGEIHWNIPHFSQKPQKK